MDNKSAEQRPGWRASDFILVPLVAVGLLITSILIRFDFLKQKD